MTRSPEVKGQLDKLHVSTGMGYLPNGYSDNLIQGMTRRIQAVTDTTEWYSQY